MEKVINLPTIEAIKEFVRKAQSSGDMVLVSKDGFRIQIDGASMLGMMAVIGTNIRVKCLGEAGPLSSMLERYSVAK